MFAVLMGNCGVTENRCGGCRLHWMYTNNVAGLGGGGHRIEAYLLISDNVKELPTDPTGAK